MIILYFYIYQTPNICVFFKNVCYEIFYIQYEAALNTFNKKYLQIR